MGGNPQVKNRTRPGGAGLCNVEGDKPLLLMKPASAGLIHSTSVARMVGDVTPASAGLAPTVPTT
jgi:hypothetical protein